MTFEEALTRLLSQGIVELSGDLLVVRLPGRTGADKHSALMKALTRIGVKSHHEASDPTLWAFAMKGSLLLGPSHSEVLVFLDSSTKTLSSQEVS